MAFKYCVKRKIVFKEILSIYLETVKICMNSMYFSKKRVHGLVANLRVRPKLALTQKERQNTLSSLCV